MIYTVTLNPALDCVMALDALETGAVNRCTRQEMVFGGKGINVSLMLHALGTESVALGFIAGFTGDAIANGLEKSGVKSDFVRVEKGFSRVNVKLHHGAETEINGPGPEIRGGELAVLLQKLAVLGENDTVVLSGSVPRSLPADVYAQVAKITCAHEARLVVDADGALLAETLPFAPFLVKPNKTELERFFGEAADSLETIIALAKRLQEKGAKNVLVSLAGDGAVLCTEQGEVYRVPAEKGTVVNSVGAGDSMLGGFLAALGRGKPMTDALALGAAAGSATAFSVGIAPFQKVMALYAAAKTEVERIG